MHGQDGVVGGEEYCVTPAPRHILDLRIGLALVRFKSQRKSCQACADPAAVLGFGRCGNLAGGLLSAIPAQTSGKCDSEGSEHGYRDDPARRQEHSWDRWLKHDDPPGMKNTAL